MLGPGSAHNRRTAGGIGIGHYAGQALYFHKAATSEKPPDLMRPLTLENAYLPTRYAVDVKVDYAKPNFSGQLVAEVDRTGIDNDDEFRLVLHAHKLVIMSAQVSCESQPAKKAQIAYDRQAQTVTLTVPEKLPNKVSVHISYMGQINTIKTFKDTTQGLFKTNYSDAIEGRSDNLIIATHMQPHGARLVFPVIDELSLKVPIKLSIETRDDFSVASVGILEKKDQLEDGMAKFHFKETPPIATSVFGFVAGHFDHVEAHVSGIPVRVYALKGEAENAQAALSLITKLLPTLEDLLGCKFPLDKLDFVALPFLSDGAMENWGLVTVISSQLLIMDSDEVSLQSLHQLLAHELVHQWIGNLVTFEDWRDLWFNEAFATWFGNYALYLVGLYPNFKLNMILDYEKMMDRDCFLGSGIIPSIHDCTKSLSTGLECSTSTLFDRTAYEKGINMLNMAANLVQQDTLKVSKTYDRFSSAVSKVIQAFKFKSIKAFEFWNVVNDHASADLNAFYHSWVRQSAYPILQVSRADDTITIEQNRFIFNSDPKSQDIENSPYQVPLSIKVLDDNGDVKILNLVLSDRRTEINLPSSRLVLFNFNGSGYHRVSYSEMLIGEICSNVKYMSTEDQISFIFDSGKLLGQELYTENSLKTLIAYLRVLSQPEWKLDYEVLTMAMNYLETLNAILLHFSHYSAFQNWLARYTAELWSKLGNWDNLTNIQPNYSQNEMLSRNSILLLSRNPDSTSLCRRIFRLLMNPKPGFFVPKELLSAVFNLTMAVANQKEYKQILSMVKNSNSSILAHTNASVSELQTVAVSSLSFCESEELLAKSLNFTMTNIDSKLIELSLLGFQFKPSKHHRLKIFEWYNLHYDQWAKKSLRKGSDWAKQLASTMKNMDLIILGDIMQYDKELILKRKRFVEEKLAKLSEHGLKDIMEEIEAQNEEKKIIGKYYDRLEKEVFE
ncbi:hypothetical protein PGUG_03173 [Meyerozyma guilliermondii ATCC 6260]|uniref:Aminopeptidase n=1 Tax=Meyerozyma guilliermondii (strain ATCC 6260 / CBS 566 / DSM 6381 / JCM 1539 / NBRC 10279 / NRRL Y-324) TaxID=294746 RepID=A5DIS2_PICGU|nr:uncharacterized protein PGUG_03173 [Meyerozyma guilliermondii ATCC 6260]EDK39075.2 hypothetical protein PGUG_03173 [Meyerozyma guilliermondii ATCC 6260]